MNFQECLDEINANSQALNESGLNKTPPYQVLGTIISPEESDLKIEQYIFQQKNLGRDNWDVLVELGLSDNPLQPYVVFLIGGNKIIQPLSVYVSSRGV